jgi:hypothetical protein
VNNVAEFPRPQACHHCDQPYVGAICPICKEERPAYTALKAMSAKPGVQPVSVLPACRYYPKALCNCELRGTCLDAA